MSARPGAPYLAGAPLLIAHRGGAALAPENTLVAFRQALDWWQADILELDVRPTRDGEVVVLHDPTVDRTTDGRGSPLDLTLAQIRELDAGHRFTTDAGATFPYRGAGLRIPTLTEVLAAFPGHRINVEIKDFRAGRRVRELVLAATATGRVLLAAEDGRARRAAGPYAGPISASSAELRAFHLHHRLHLTRLYRPRVDALQLPRVYRGREIPTAQLVRDAHALNLAVHVWTVDDVQDMHRLLENGVDGVVTDRPDRLARVLHERVGRPLPPGPPDEVNAGFLERLLLA